MCISEHTRSDRHHHHHTEYQGDEQTVKRLVSSSQISDRNEKNNSNNNDSSNDSSSVTHESFFIPFSEAVANMDSPESIVSSLDPEDNEVHFCKKCSKVSHHWISTRLSPTAC